MPLLPPRLAVGLLLALAGCQEQAPPPPLEVVDWSGRDQICLVLDQPLRVQFSAPLRAPLPQPPLLRLPQQGRAERDAVAPGAG